MLPIILAAKEVGPFFGVVFTYLLGTTNAYYAFGLKSLPEAFMIIFQVTFLQELELDELEGVDVPSMRLLPDGTIETSPPEASRNYYVVRIFICVVIFVMSTALMNIFIAVLADAYATASNNALNEFLRARANIALEQHIMMTGLKKIWAKVRDRLCVREIMRSISGVEVDEEAQLNYLWYFSPDKGQADESDDDQANQIVDGEIRPRRSVPMRGSQSSYSR